MIVNKLPTGMYALVGIDTLTNKVGPRFDAPAVTILPYNVGLASVVLITPFGARLATVNAPPTFNVFVPSVYINALAVPVMEALPLSPTTSINLSPIAPPTAP